jgi:hypothetical protein
VGVARKLFSLHDVGVGANVQIPTCERHSWPWQSSAMMQRRSVDDSYTCRHYGKDSNKDEHVMARHGVADRPHNASSTWSNVANALSLC